MRDKKRDKKIIMKTSDRWVIQRTLQTLEEEQYIRVDLPDNCSEESEKFVKSLLRFCNPERKSFPEITIFDIVEANSFEFLPHDIIDAFLDLSDVVVELSWGTKNKLKKIRDQQYLDFMSEDILNFVVDFKILEEALQRTTKGTSIEKKTMRGKYLTEDELELHQDVLWCLFPGIPILFIFLSLVGVIIHILIMAFTL